FRLAALVLHLGLRHAEALMVLAPLPRVIERGESRERAGRPPDDAPELAARDDENLARRARRERHDPILERAEELPSDPADDADLAERLHELDAAALRDDALEARR